jgi:hypothetical protein
MALLGLVERLRAGTRRLAADVKKVGAVIDHLQRGTDRTLRVEQHATVGE